MSWRFLAPVLAVFLIVPVNSAVAGVRVLKRIDLSKYDQPWAQMFPGDLDGDGETDFLFTSGTYSARAIRSDGKLLWEIVNPKGVQNAEPWHPWGSAVFDVDNDGANEAVIFRKKGDDPKPWLTIVNGKDGSIKSERQLWFEATTENYQRRGLLAIAYMRNKEIPDIIIGSNDTLNDVAAFDARLNQLWYRRFGTEENSEYAGHYIWAYDVNDDGLQELFVGKFLIDGQGRELWRMKELKSDHVDALACADMDPQVAGKEVVVCGKTGMRMFDARGTLLLEVKLDIVRDPQRLAIGEFRKDMPGLEIAVTERASVPNQRTLLLDCKGRVLQENVLSASAKLQIDWDGDRSQDEMLSHAHRIGAVESGSGTELVSANWYLPAGAQFNWRVWWAYPLAMDVAGDSREEILQWGKDELVIGGNDAANPAPAPSLRARRDYRLRYANIYMNRSPIYFDYRALNPK